MCVCVSVCTQQFSVYLFFFLWASFSRSSRMLIRFILYISVVHQLLLLRLACWLGRCCCCSPNIHSTATICFREMFTLIKFHRVPANHKLNPNRFFNYVVLFFRHEIKTREVNASECTAHTHTACTCRGRAERKNRLPKIEMCVCDWCF